MDEKRKTILIVDDEVRKQQDNEEKQDKLGIEPLSLLLQTMGFEVVLASDSETAVAAFLQYDCYAAIIDLWFHDNGHGGYQVLEELKLNGFRGPAILWTGDGRERLRMQAINVHGFDAMVCKTEGFTPIKKLIEPGSISISAT